jgi:DNA-binding FrmR family transcriptional regulator
MSCFDDIPPDFFLPTVDNRKFYEIILLTPPPPGGVLENEMNHHEDAQKRLRNVAGHVQGIARMVENDAYCIDVIRQIQAVQAALNKVNAIILEGHLNSCVITAVQGENPADREKVLSEISDVFQAATKV